MKIIKEVIILFGGVAPERDVSIITGVTMLNALNKTDGYHARGVYVTKDGKWYTGEVLKNLSFYSAENIKKLEEVAILAENDCLFAIKRGKVLKKLCKVSCAVNCFHGGCGEDGSVEGLLKLAGIPSASPPLATAAVAMDKALSKIVLAGLKLKFVKHLRVNKREFVLREKLLLGYIERVLSYPLIVKPARLGSSIGVVVVRDKETLRPALEAAFAYDTKVIVENYITSPKEYNCAAFARKGQITVSEVEEPLTKKEILSFSDKYGSGNKDGGEKKFPAEIEKSLREKIRETTLTIYRKLDFSGVIRIDYLYSDGELYVNEINGVPGSLAYYLFCSLKELPEFLIGLIEEGISRFNAEKCITKTFSSDLLKGLTLSGAKKLK